MTTLVMEQTEIPVKLSELESDTGSAVLKLAPVKEPAFRSFLALGIISGRGLRTYCTPCHARGATF